MQLIYTLEHIRSSRHNSPKDELRWFQLHSAEWTQIQWSRVSERERERDSCYIVKVVLWTCTVLRGGRHSTCVWRDSLRPKRGREKAKGKSKGRKGPIFCPKCTCRINLSSMHKAIEKSLIMSLNWPEWVSMEERLCSAKSTKYTSIQLSSRTDGPWVNLGIFCFSLALCTLRPDLDNQSGPLRQSGWCDLINNSYHTHTHTSA